MSVSDILSTIGSLDLPLDAVAIKARAQDLFSNAADIDAASLISCVDLTTLEPTDTHASVSRLAERAIDPAGDGSVDHVAAICTYPRFVATAASVVAGSGVKVASVAGGFPSAQTTRAVKTAEIAGAVADGAEEIDVVMPIGDLLADNDAFVVEDLLVARDAARDATLKVIIESGILDDAMMIRKAALIAALCGADFVKTSTGKAGAGATPEAVLVIAEALTDLGAPRGIKVSGGVRDETTAAGYAAIVSAVLGPRALSADRFRIGASSLLGSLVSARSGS